MTRKKTTEKTTTNVTETSNSGIGNSGYYEIHDETILLDLIESAKREGAIEIRNLYGSPKCEALHHPKKYQHTALEDCPVEKEINALTEQSEESEE